ncbi:MAG: M48 family metallopeptidase [Candidatus Omnitrophota bacterium]
MLNKLKRYKLAVSFPVLFFISAGCVSIYNPATERNETLFIDTAKEVSLGATMDQELRGKLKIINSPQINNRLNSIGAKLSGFSDRKDLTYHFKVVSDKELNAFAIPGGYVYVNSGLMESANDDELAGVVAHEIGHIAARHSVKQLQTVMGYQIILSIITGISAKNDINSALNVIFNLVNLGYSRKDEFLADKLAVRYVRRAGFSPVGIVTFFGKLKKEGERKGTGVKLVFLSSHPPIEQRIARVEQEMAIFPY